MSLYDTVKEEYAALVASVREKLADGSLGVADWFSFVRQIIGSAAVIAESTDVPGPEKRQLAIDLVLDFWDDVLVDALAKIDLPGPDRIIRRMIRKAIPAGIGFVMDWLIDEYNLEHGHKWLESVKTSTPS